jgi:hypothetical protein
MGAGLWSDPNKETDMITIIVNDEKEIKTIMRMMPLSFRADLYVNLEWGKISKEMLCKYRKDY